MEVSQYSYDNGADIRIYESLRLLNQRFDVVNLKNGYYAIMPAHSGKSLDVKGRNQNEGGNIQQHDYISESQQMWRIDRNLTALPNECNIRHHDPCQRISNLP